MANINKVMLSGRLTRDPEIRSTAGGMSVLSIGLAVNDRRKNQQTGQWEDAPNFVDCTVFGKRADGLYGILSKGALVCIEGKLRYSTWERDGQRRSKLEVVVDEIEVLSASRERAVDSGDYYQSQPQQPDEQQPDFYDEDVPF